MKIRKRLILWGYCSWHVDCIPFRVECHEVFRKQRGMVRRKMERRRMSKSHEWLRNDELKLLQFPIEKLEDDQWHCTCHPFCKDQRSVQRSKINPYGNLHCREEMVDAERRITDNERINIIVEYACLGQEPKAEVIFHLHTIRQSIQWNYLVTQSQTTPFTWGHYRRLRSLLKGWSSDTVWKRSESGLKINHWMNIITVSEVLWSASVHQGISTW